MLVVLGAGASHDCIPSTVPANAHVTSGLSDIGGTQLTELIPPLANGIALPTKLSNWAIGRLPTALPAVSHLRRALRGTGATEQVVTMEQALRSYQQSAERVPARSGHLLAFRFYLRDLFGASGNFMGSSQVAGGDTNHVALVSRVMDWIALGSKRRAVFVSFNYDLILEDALAAQYGFNPLHLEGYAAHDDFQLLKPHGSVAWYWPLTGPTFTGLEAAHAQVSLDTAQASGVEEESRKIHCLDWRPGLRMNEVPLAVPALALPINGKTRDTFVWPADQREVLNPWHGRFSTVLCVGWRGLEPHFLPLVAPAVREDAKVLIICGGPQGAEDAAAITRHLQQTLRCADQDRWRSCGDGFVTLMESSGELDWLLD